MRLLIIISNYILLIYDYIIVFIFYYSLYNDVKKILDLFYF